VHAANCRKNYAGGARVIRADYSIINAINAIEPCNIHLQGAGMAQGGSVRRYRSHMRCQRGFATQARLNMLRKSNYM
jgi:hypothetical protein